jgi:hypothetical protein
MLEILKGASPHDRHQWTLTTRLVAEGYGVKPETIRTHKSNHSDELLLDHHYLIDGNVTHWTRAGVVRLGMFIRSEEAIAFRNAAEQYLCNAAKPSLAVGVGNTNASPTLLDASALEIPTLIDAIVEDLADDILASEIRQRLDKRLIEKRAERNSLVNAVEKLQLPIPRKWSQSA